MQYFIMPIGLPGSGKSTISKELAAKYNAKIFSSDEYRKQILGDVRNQSDNPAIFNKLKEDVLSHMKEGGSCIFDACSTTSKHRREMLVLLESIDCKKIAYVLRTNINTCIQRDKTREFSVGKFTIFKFVSSYDIPYYTEGFDEIILEGLEDNNPLPVNSEGRRQVFSLMENFDQCNPHHKYKLLEHSTRLSDQYEKDSIGYEAGLFHDTGKLFTQTFDENNIAHYYAHSNWSTYYMLEHIDLFNLSSIDDILECLFLINNHMKIRDILRSNKSTNKHKKMWGEELFNKLVRFMECDGIATGIEDN